VIGLLLLAMSAVAHEPAASAPESVFACQYFRNDAEASDGSVHTVDLRVAKRTDGTWTLQRQNDAVVIATEFPADFGSIGGSVGLRWEDGKGKRKTAYISYSDIVAPAGKKYFWLSFDHPSLWQAPGFGCESQGDAAGGAA
jgi:hypothetical protein